MRIAVSPIIKIIMVLVIVLVIIPLNDIIIIWNMSRNIGTITKGVIHILSNPSPSTVGCSRTPHNDITTGEVEVDVVHIHDHHVRKLPTVHPILVFSHRMAAHIIEGLKLLQFHIVTLFQIIPVLKQINILKAVIIGVDIIFLCSLTKVQHTIVFAVDIDYHRFPGCPVDICVHTHHTLCQCVAQIKVFKIIATITQHQ